MATIGKPVDRQDGRLKVTGGAKYSAEWDVPGCLHAALVLSPISRGRVLSFDLKEAQSLPGVKLILTHENMLKLNELNPSVGGEVGTLPGEDRIPLSDNEITYNGQIIAVVVADTLERARHAAERVKPNLLTQSPIVDMQRTVLVLEENKAGGAGKDAGQETAQAPKKATPPQIGTRVQPQNASKTRGDRNALAGAAKKAGGAYTTPHEHHNPIESHAIICQWQGDNLTAYLSSQSTRGPQRLLAHAFRLPDENVRAVSHFIGGGFGSKGPGAWTHDIVCAAAAKMVGAPVKLSLRRQEMFTLTGHRGQTEQQLQIGAGTDGKITAVRHLCLTDAHPNNGFFERPAQGTSRLLYAIPNYEMAHQSAQVNIAPPIFMRAPGESPGMWALECALDEMAHELGIDPVQFRITNHADVHPDSGRPWSSKHLLACYEQGKTLIGWDKRALAPRMVKQGRYFIGWGMATATYGGNRQAASARVRLYPDGRAIAASSGCDIGTGAYTAFRQVAADALGLPLEQVTMELGDSDLPYAPVAGGSQLTASVAPAVHEACEQALNDIVKLARMQTGSAIYGAKADDVKVTGGRVHLVGNSGKSESIADVVKRTGKEYVEHCVRAETMMTAKRSQGLKQSQRPPCLPIAPSSEVDADMDKYAFQSFGAQFCKLRVDEELGQVRLLDFATVLDVGTVLNPKTARSQVIGGVTFGIGMTLMEETLYHPQDAKVGAPGRPVIRNLADYHITSHADTPPIQVAFIGQPDPHINVLGARGIGEIGITGVAAAIGNAVFNATGKRIRDLPLVPEKVMA